MANKYLINIDGTGLGQTTRETCWLSAYKMIHRAAGRPDGGIRQAMQAAGLPYDDFYYNGLPKEQYLPARDSLKLDSFFPSYVKQCADSPDDFIHLLKTRGPFWCSVNRGRGLHIIVVNGYDPAFKQVLGLNPWNETVWGTADFLPMPADDFKRWVTDYSGSCQFHRAWQPVPADQQ
jgi:hypothetical protein